MTVQVSPPPATAENLTVTTALVRSRSNNRYTWELDGQSSITTGNSISVTVATTTGPVLLGTTTVPVTGRWRLSVTTTNITPAATPTATITTSHGTVRTVTLGTR
ncbi:hypothetical protein D3C85_1712470 [compost metagenome]